MPHRKLIAELIQRNQSWAEQVTEQDSEYFLRHLSGQSPDILWIGCVDSRVQPSVITKSRAGELLIHRNVANQIHPEDDESLSTIEFAIHKLKIDHIVVCGHTHCGGVSAACNHDLSALDATPALQRWVTPIHEDYLEHRERVDASPTPITALVRINVLTQLRRIAALPVVQDAWARGEAPLLHGLVYHIRGGQLEHIAMWSRDGLSQEDFRHFP